MERSIGKAAQIKSLLTSFMKSHAVYDGNGRTTHFYECPTFTDHGEICLLTEFTYVGTSPNVTNSKESKSTWDSTWDI
ncbi:MAG: hypothetical protein U9O94_02720 [Nanoarchaeota archaeon]|nr:hypothetical protein [Nanoarchaeota archaeon]